MGGARYRKQRRAGKSIALIVTSLLLASCSAHHHADPTPSSPRKTPPSPSISLPTAPTAKPTPGSAEDFVRYFWAVNNYAYAALDPDVLRTLAEPTCSYCKNISNTIDQLRRAQSKVSGGTIRLNSLSAPPVKIQTGIIVRIVLSQDSGMIIHRDGSIQNHPPLSSSPGFVGLAWTGRGWLVDDVSFTNSTDKP